MAQHRDPPPLEVQESFEITRLARQCLVEAYTRLVPIRRKALEARYASPPSAAVTTSRRGGEHG